MSYTNRSLSLMKAKENNLHICCLYEHMRSRRCTNLVSFIAIETPRCVLFSIYSLEYQAVSKYKPGGTQRWRCVAIFSTRVILNRLRAYHLSPGGLDSRNVIYKMPFMTAHSACIDCCPDLQGHELNGTLINWGCIPSVTCALFDLFR